MKAPLLLVSPLAALLFVSSGFAQELTPYVSEFMADNRGTLVDGDDDSSDWIEIHHRGAAPVSLENYTLTDDPENLSKWSFPSVELQPDERLIVFASGKDRSAGDEMHTNFSLDADGEYLALISPDGIVLSSWDAYSEQAEDESYGLAGETRAVTVLDTESLCRWLVPFGDRQNLEWTEPDFDDSRWFGGLNGIGYDFGLDYHEWIQTDLSFDMSGFATSAQIRFPFVVPDPDSLAGFRMQMRFDDGFVAFLNGERVAEFAAPEDLRTSSMASDDREPKDAIQELAFDLTEWLSLIVEGENLLAIQGLDESATSGDFLIHPRVELIYPVEEPSYGIMPEPTPGGVNGESFAGRVSPVVFEQTPRFLKDPLALELRTETPGAAIYYTYAGAEPTIENGFLYDGPVVVDETLAIRARAFKEGLLPSRTSTRTYILTEELLTQSVVNQSVVREDGEALQASVKSALPIVSIAVDSSAMFGDGGLDTIPEQTREVPVSIEYFSDAEAGEGFQIDAGLAIHGGNARSHPKKPYRLFFRRQYGSARLNYPLFGDSPVAGFDQLILRAGGHDSWSLSPDFGASQFDLPYHATYLRDQFLRKTETEMGMLSPRGRYVQVILNGFYWGIYDLHERPNATFFQDHQGGKRSDWDVLHHSDTLDDEWALIDGKDDTWKNLQDRMKAGVRNPEDYEQVRDQVDLDHLIDSLIVRIWSADFDWAGPVFWDGEEVTFFRNKNWYAGQQRGDTPGFFQFFTWDAEMSMGSHLLSNVFGEGIEMRVTNFDLTSVNDPGTPTAFHGALRYLPDYRRRFGDRIQKHFFAGGMLEVPTAQARLDQMINELDPLMVAESARWGDLHQIGPILTKAEHWDPEVAWLRDGFLPERTETLLEQLRNANLFPDTTAPAMIPRGGSLDDIAQVELRANEGALYYTTDGSDPATTVSFNRRVLIDESSPSHYLIPSQANGGANLGDTWKEVEAPVLFENWTEGTASIGYEVGEVFYESHFETDLSEMNQVNTTGYVRIPFEVPSADVVETLILRMKYDDGFAVYLNGELLVAEAAPDDLSWVSESTFRRADEDAVFFRDFNVSVGKGLLRDGGNLLAIQALNGSITSSDLLMAPQLVAIETDGASVPSASAKVYAAPLLLSESTTVKARVLSDTGEWSALTEGFFFPGQTPDAVSLAISEIHYHPLSSEDAGSSAFEFVEIANTGTAPIQLGRLRFSEGIEFEFSEGVLGAGERALIVNDRAAFLSRYGEGLASQVLGEYGAESRLSNGGETLTLVDDDGNMIDRISYDDGGDWPSAADGDGGSLERVSLVGDGSASSWRVSATVGGSPGEGDDGRTYANWKASIFGEDAVGEPLEDPDDDGHSNLVEYFSDTDPRQRDEGSALAIAVNEAGDGLLLSYRRATSVNDVTIVVERSSDLTNWEREEALGGTEPLGDETVLVKHAVEASEKRWYRLNLTLMP